MLSRRASYEEIYTSFRWNIPEYYNIAVDVCDKWAVDDPSRVALINIEPAGKIEVVTYGELRLRSNRLANLLRSAGVSRGSRVAVLLPQCADTAIAHIATYKLGGIAVPLSILFGPDALEYRLRDAGVEALVTTSTSYAKLASCEVTLPDLKKVCLIDQRNFQTELAACSPQLEAVRTRAEDPALLIYTSGTTGMPKGALHAHRVLLGHLPGVEISHDFIPQAGDRLWTPADWAWIGGLLDVLFPALHHGISVVAYRFEKFSGAEAFRLIEKFEIKNAFIPPTALKMMRNASLLDRSLNLTMRSVASGGETLGPELLKWGRDTLGVSINEFYGQTECNMIVSSCGALDPPKPGFMGRPVPGHDVRIVDDAGIECPEGAAGNIAIRSGDPVMFLGYWNNPKATESKFVGDWMLTGDKGIREHHGWLRFLGRDDDVITSAGYRIGPGEVEDCLLKHPAVEMAGVVGKPDKDRTEIVKAYVVLKRSFKPSAELAANIGDFVRSQLAAHEYPREVAFVDQLPLTVTGKIMRRELRELASREAASAVESYSSGLVLAQRNGL